jgi:hypothetical protein
MPPGELTLLQIRLLFGNDVWPAFFSSSYVGCVAGAAMLAGSLGAGRAGRWLAAAFVASTPIVILEATSTQNDLVVSLWLVILANMALWEYRSGARSTFPWIVGVVVLRATEPPVIYFAAALWMLLAYLQTPAIPRSPVRQLYRRGRHGLPPLTRISSPCPGPKEVVGSLPSSAAGGPVIGLVRAIPDDRAQSDEFVPQINRRISAFFEAVPEVFGSESAQDLDQALWNHEDTAGNPLQVTLALATISLTLLGWPSGGERVHRSYAIVVLAGYLLLPMVIHAAATTVGAIRYQIPFLVLAAPFVGRAVDRGASPRLAYWAAGLAIAFAVPWVLFNNTRPMIGIKPQVTRTESLLVIAPEVLFSPCMAASSTSTRRLRTASRR